MFDDVIDAKALAKRQNIVCQIFEISCEAKCLSMSQNIACLAFFACVMKKISNYFKNI